MAKFNVDVDFDVRATVQVEAENLEEAIKKLEVRTLNFLTLTTVL